jgi:hypothetical protein
MEIQTFLLCKSVTKAGAGAQYDGQLLGLHSFHPLDGRFPLTFSVHYYLLLRREARGHDEPATLLFNLIDQDGRPAGAPANFSATTVFPAGHRFFNISGSIEISVPGPGDYRLDVTAADQPEPFTYQYGIEITPGPSQEAPRA